MSKFKCIVEFVKNGCRPEALRDEGDYFECYIRDKGYNLRLNVRRELTVLLPHVDDFRICPACKIRHRARRSAKKDYCRACKNEKFKLALKGVTQKSLDGNLQIYDQLVGSMSLLRKLKNAVRRDTQKV